MENIFVSITTCFTLWVASRGKRQFPSICWLTSCYSRNAHLTYLIYKKFNKALLQIIVGDEKSGERTITIPAKMAMYEVKASLSYMGSKLSTTRHLYMKQLLDLPRKLCFKWVICQNCSLFSFKPRGGGWYSTEIFIYYNNS